MTQATQFVIGAKASCTDGECGTVIRVVINPVAEAVTDLVVEPTHRSGLGRLVPLKLIEPDPDGQPGDLRIACTLAEFARLGSAEDTQFVPGTSAFAEYGPDQVVAWPYYGLGGGLGFGIDPGAGPGDQTVTTDAIPAGEVAIRRGDPVHATDGTIGKVQGLVIEPASHHVTHVLLQEGHLWGRKDVAIPIGAVARTDDGIRLSITKDEVKDLPAVDLDRPVGPAPSQAAKDPA
jgi:sporulation protein YlmC with PRC-barrel domain